MMQAALPLAGLTAVEMGTSVAGPFAGQVLADLGVEVIKIENPQGGDDARNWGPPFVRGAALASEASGQRGHSTSARAGHSPEEGSSARAALASEASGQRGHSTGARAGHSPEEGSSARAAPIFNAVNRNKRSAAVDLKDAAQRAALARFIVAEADIVLQNLRPGLVEQYRLDAASLRAERPSLIYCNLAAYGAEGPLKDRPGYDPLMQAFGGLMSLTGVEGGEPVRTGPSIIDQGTAMWAVIGILSALNRRAATGEGCTVDTSLYETALGWTNMHVAGYLATGRVPRRMGSENFGICPYKAYRARDGWVVVAAGNNNLFQRLAEALGHPEWPRDPRFRSNPDRVTNRDALNPLVAQAIAGDTVAAWVDRLGAAGVPCAPVLDLGEVMAHPQFAAVGMLLPGPDGAMPLIATPLKFDGERPPFRSHPPALGEHSDAVLGRPPRRKASSS